MSPHRSRPLISCRSLISNIAIGNQNMVFPQVFSIFGQKAQSDFHGLTLIALGLILIMKKADMKSSCNAYS